MNDTAVFALACIGLGAVIGGLTVLLARADAKNANKYARYLERSEAQAMDDAMRLAEHAEAGSRVFEEPTQPTPTRR